MSAHPQRTFKIGRVESKSSPVVSVHETTFPGLAKILTRHITSPKKDTPGWTASDTMVGPRSKKTAVPWEVVALDIEGKCEGDKEDGKKKDDTKKWLIGPKAPEVAAVAQRIEQIGWPAIIATSWWHEGPSEGGGTVGPRYRIVFDISRTVTHDERALLGRHIAAILGLTESFDPCVDAESRFFYLPAAPAERMHLAQSFVTDGDPIDVDAMLRQCTVEHQVRQSDTQPAPTRSQRPQTSVIDAFNEAGDFATILTQHGYKRIGTRWLSPVSTSGEPGIVLFDNGRLYCHHHNDPLYLADHARDLFDVWATLEHAGNENAAVRAAAKMLGIDRQDAYSAPVEAGTAQDSQTSTATPTANLDEPEHPLAIEVPLSNHLAPPRMVIPGFVAEGIVSFAGQHGIGKTTGILPLSFVAAGLIKNELTPDHWRHVVYVTEDAAQAQRIIAGLAGSLGLDYDTITQRFHLVEASRMHVSAVVTVAKTYAERYTRFEPHQSNGTLVELKPLVVFDTKSAVFSMQNENDAAEAAELMAALKQRFNKFPVWIIGHIAKASFGKSDALSARGSTAIEADAHQNAYIVAEGDHRFIVLGKRRFEAKWTEIELVSEVSESVGLDEFGVAQTVAIRWAIPKPPTVTRKEAAAAALVESNGESDTQRRTAILKAVEDAWLAGNPISKRGVRELVTGRVATINAVTETLLIENWLYEVEVPADRLVNNNKKAFLVRLTDSERRAVIESGRPPPDKMRLFPTWAKGVVSLVPDTLKNQPKNQDIEGEEKW